MSKTEIKHIVLVENLWHDVSLIFCWLDLFFIGDSRPIESHQKDCEQQFNAMRNDLDRHKTVQRGTWYVCALAAVSDGSGFRHQLCYQHPFLWNQLPTFLSTPIFQNHVFSLYIITASWVPIIVILLSDEHCNNCFLLRVNVSKKVGHPSIRSGI